MPSLLRRSFARRAALLRLTRLFWLGGRLGRRRWLRRVIDRRRRRRRGVITLLIRQLHLRGIVVVDVGPRRGRIVFRLLGPGLGRVVRAWRQRPLERAARQLRRIAIHIVGHHRLG